MEQLEADISESNMEVDAESVTQAEPVEYKEKPTEEPSVSSALMNSGDGVQIFSSTLLEEIPSTSKSRVKRRNRSFTEFEASRRILLPRSSKTRAYESLRNIAKPITPSKSTLGSRSVTSKHSRKSKNSGSVKKRVGRTGGGYRRGSCRYGAECSVHKKCRCWDRQDSRMSLMSADTSGTAGSGSDKCSCCYCRYYCRTR